VARRDYLFKQAEKAEKLGIRVVLVQIEEAHTDAWPIGRDHQPKNHDSMETRMKAARDFVKDYSPPYDVFVDDFETNQFENTFQAWPDKYYFIDHNYNIINKSQYDDGVIMVDYTEIIDKMYDDAFG